MNSTPPVPDAPAPGDPAPGVGASQPQGPVRWKGLVTALRAVSGVVDKVLAAICLVLFTAMVVIVGWQVFTREILNNSAPWTEEAARYTFVVLAIFSAAYVFSERGHIAVEMLIEKLPGNGQKVAGVVIEVIVSAFIGVAFVLGGALVAQNAWGQDIATLPLSVGQIYTVMPVAGAIIIYYSLVHIVSILTGAEAPVPVEDDFKEAI